MKVRFKLEDSIDKKRLVVLWEKDQSSGLVNFYPLEEKEQLEDWVSDINNAFRKMWH